MQSGYRRIQWLAVGLPALVLGLFEFVRHQVLEPFLPPPAGNLAAAVVVAAGAYGFVRLLIGLVERTTAELHAARAEGAVLAERQRIAREMHDGVAQALFYLGVKLERLERFLAGGDIQAARQVLAEVRGQLAATQSQVRAVISNLKEAAGAESFTAALRRLAARFGALGLPVEVAVAGEPRPDGRTQEQILAIVQEALTNALKHSGARSARVQVEAGPQGLRLVVADDGRGFDPARIRGGGHGLAIMAERARMVGGDLRVEAAPGRGTRMTLVVPEVAG